jgi:hypothetical protein
MFDLVTSHDFYAMLVQDFDEFMDEQSSARRALHCAITAYHLHEWVWGDWLAKDYGTWKALGIRDRDAFFGWIDHVCPWFPVIQNLANGTKHFIRDPGFESKKIGGFGRDFGVAFGQGYLLINFGEGAAEHQYYAASTLLEVVLRFWRDFFLKYRPIPNLPVSSTMSISGSRRFGPSRRRASIGLLPRASTTTTPACLTSGGASLSASRRRRNPVGTVRRCPC